MVKESLVEQFAGQLSELIIPRDVLAWRQASYAESDLAERAAREHIIKQHQAQYERLQSRIEVLYNDRLDGQISPTFYDQKAADIRGPTAGASAKDPANRRRCERRSTACGSPLTPPRSLSRKRGMSNRAYWGRC
jgi:hypothetical protein